MKHALVLAAGLAACQQASISVSTGSGADYHHKELDAAITKFVADGRTPAAFGELARLVHMLRAGMDRSVAEEAERKLIVLALDPVKAVADQPAQAQAQVLATTVWPALLEPAIEADTPLDVHDPKSFELAPHAGEAPDA